MNHGLVAPQFEHPLDVDEYLNLVPGSATIKGIFVSSLIDRLGPERAQLAVTRPRYLPFKDYPLIEQVKLVAAIAPLLYPKLSLREAIRRLGHSIYPAFAATLVGKVSFAAVGHDVRTLLTAGAKAYQYSSSVGRAEVVEFREGFCLLNMREMYNFIDCYQVGILEGALATLGCAPRVKMCLESLTSGIFEVTW
jgi:uncharacterized protein (TIGR02265 family)